MGSLNHAKGVRTAIFTQEEVKKLSAPFQFTLVGKFSFGRPQVVLIKEYLVRLGCASARVQLLNRCHWTPNFNLKHEPFVALIWVRFSCLPLHLFDKRALFTIGELLGDPLKIDDATKTLSRINFARICIEIDLRHKPPTEVSVVNAGEWLIIPVIYEKLPQYCAHLGHEESSCYINNAGPRPRRNLEKSIPPQ
ncbi:hypothetical protein CDL12_01433 [Handroanthus impetiginosus]|uniref:Uncharacterized protein n=1 Tax=Handroanthus impetiginosus TaxID=429701 RepID=A0A2G9I7U6_9LAMI|nr:hypothetical protein CDL12_01433 [Handroanthus impetiginosus]